MSGPRLKSSEAFKSSPCALPTSPPPEEASPRRLGHLLGPWYSLILILGLLASLVAGSPAWAAGSSPRDPIVFNLGSAPRSVTLARGQAVWVSVRFTPASNISHMRLETQGNVDTILTAYANLNEALRDERLAEDDDGGSDFNALLTIPLGFPSPYLVRLTGYGSSSGTFQLRGTRTFVPAERCDWPAGCPLAIAAAGEPEEASLLGTLRDVRSEILSESARGRALIGLYWRVGADLVPELLLQPELRRRTFREVEALLPLATTALEITRGTDSDVRLSSEQVDRMRGLLELLEPHLSTELGAELWQQWYDIDLPSRTGSPLTQILAETELATAQVEPVTVVAKLKVEPEMVMKSGQPQLLTGSSRLDAQLFAAGARATRRVHAESAERRAAGLTRTIAFEVGNLAAARALIAQLSSDPEIEWAQVSARMQIFTEGTDPFRGALWGLDAIRAPQAWPTSTGSCSTPVAVVDTGLRVEMADLQGRVLRNRGYDFVDNDPTPQDDHGHGTHVSGIIASAVNNATSVAGVAPGICVFGVRVLDAEGSGSAEGVAAGIVHAVDQGAKVINLSLGCDCDVQQVIEDALGYAAARDVVVAAASGNDSLSHLGYPASSPRTISVGAVNPDLTLASFSNFGPGLDLVAPGVDVVSLFRDGESCMGSGTSMATPHVAGVAALVRSLNPTLGREQVRNVLRNQARDLGSPGYDNRFGAGLVDARRSLASATPPCGPGQCLSLHQGRFEARIDWRDARGNTGTGRVAPLGTNASGLFWFFNANNWEMLVKVLNGCSVNNHYWVFAAATTNVEYTLRVTDKQTGVTTSYFNALGRAAPAIIDTEAFRTCSGSREAGEPLEAPADGAYSLEPLAIASVSLEPLPVKPQTVEPQTVEPLALEPLPLEPSPIASEIESQGEAATGCSAGQMCLNRGRFRVEVNWRDFQGNTGSGHGVRGSDTSGLMWFFNANNWEMLVKVLNGCGTNGHYWVFSAATTNVQYTLKVTDTTTGRSQQYRNPQGVASAAVNDTMAFACP